MTTARRAALKVRMATPYTLNGELRLKRVTLTHLDGSTVANLYLFKVPYSLVESTKPSALLYDPNAHLDSLIDQDKSEWETFVTFGLDVPWQITTELNPSFNLPQKPFREMTTSHRIDVYQLTDEKL
jgi:hypothetical protein